MNTDEHGLTRINTDRRESKTFGFLTVDEQPVKKRHHSEARWTIECDCW